MDAISVINDELARLRREADAIRRQIEEKSTSLKVIEQSAKSLESVIAKLSNDDGEQSLVLSPGVSKSRPLMYDQRSAGKPKPAVAVVAFVRQHPDGVPVSEVVNQLEGEISSVASDRKRLLYSTVFHLKKRGRLEQFSDANGTEFVKLRS